MNHIRISSFIPQNGCQVVLDQSQLLILIKDYLLCTVPLTCIFCRRRLAHSPRVIAAWVQHIYLSSLLVYEMAWRQIGAKAFVKTMLICYIFQTNMFFLPNTHILLEKINLKLSFVDSWKQSTEGNGLTLDQTMYTRIYEIGNSTHYCHNTLFAMDLSMCLLQL